jgi:CHAT domain-containing protein
VELSSLGGFARAFLEAGAQAFVSCLWSVKDTPSRVFVETLYDRLLKGDSISEAAVRARTAARDSTDDAATWLAFVIYARPDARFVRG